MSTELKEKKPLKQKIIITIIVVVVIALVGTIVILLMKRGEKKKDRDYVVTEENVKQVTKDLDEEKTAPGSYEVNMTTNWVFATGDAASEDMFIKNSTANSNTIYFDLLMKDTEELLYSSPFIPVGESLEEFRLEKPLTAGVYDAVVNYHLVDEDEKELSTVAVNVVLQVLK